MVSRHLQHPVGYRLALVFGLAAIVLVSYGSTFSSLWALWQTSDHRHGILVFPIAAFLVWRSRYELADVPLSADPRGIPLLLAMVIAWSGARLAGIQLVEHAAVLAMIPAVILTLLGWPIFRKLLFPLGFLLLATPVTDSFIPFLMTVTADISTGLLRLSGIPVLREGQYLSLPGGNFVVADVCSGARYLVTGVMIALLFGYLSYASVLKRIALVVLTAIVLVLTNGIRAYIVMAVASATEMQVFGGRDHVYFGWMLFGVVMMLMMWLGARYADPEATEPGTVSRKGVVTHVSYAAVPMIVALGLVMLAVTVKPLQADFGETGAMLAAAAALLVFILLVARQHQDAPEGKMDGSRDSGKRKKTWSVSGLAGGFIAIALLVLTPRYVADVEATAVHSVDDVAITMPAACRTVGAWPHRWQPLFQEPDGEYAAQLACQGAEVSVYVAAYASALQGRELISSSHHVVPPNWDRYTAINRHQLVLDDGSTAPVNDVVISAPGNEAVIWYWYDVDGQVAASPTGTKLRQLVALLQRRPAGGRVIVIETAADGDPASAGEVLADVASSIIGRGDSAHDASAQ